MTDKLQKAAEFFAALKTRNIDGALSCMTEDAIMATPMGKKKGHDQIRGMLGVIANMGGGDASEPEQDGETVTAVAKSPMGKVRLTFGFEGDLISEITAKLGG